MGAGVYIMEGEACEEGGAGVYLQGREEKPFEVEEPTEGKKMVGWLWRLQPKVIFKCNLEVLDSF